MARSPNTASRKIASPEVNLPAPACDLAEVRFSPVQGHGVFALRDIPVGTFLMPLTGRRRHASEIDWSAGKRVMQIDDEWFMEEAGHVDDFINHSCEPNVAFTLEGDGFYALRPIKAGEELYFDYATCENDPQWRLECRCGTKSCRGYVTGYSGLDPALRPRLTLCLPYLRRHYS